MKTLFSTIARFFAKPTTKTPLGRSFFSFQSTGEVIRAESHLAKAGFSSTIMGPPPWLQTGCDMVLVIDGIQAPAILRCLNKAGIVPEQHYPMSDDMLSPVSLVRVTDFGQWFMVQAANMKITVDKSQGTIVNVSGGGCPDVPYLAKILVGQSIATSEEPRLRGQTLCSYALQKAFEEAKKRWMQENHG